MIGGDGYKIKTFAAGQLVVWYIITLIRICYKNLIPTMFITKATTILMLTEFLILRS